MSDTPPLERDASGRFVKPEPVASPASAPDNGMHPVSRILFGWVESPATPAILLWGTIAICGALIGGDALLNRHEYLDFANFNGFYGIWGFGAFAIAVLAGWPLGRLLRRDEDYYGEGDATPRDAGREDEA